MMKEMLVYIAQEGVATTDLFRRPGNLNDQRAIRKKMADGKEVILTDYNFFTLASVIKYFLIRIPGGVFGVAGENQLLSILKLRDRIEQYDVINRVLMSLPKVSQHLISLLFGTWFRIVNQSEFNSMSSEAVAKSVAGSLFHTCRSDPKLVLKATHVLQILIDDFGVSAMFGAENIRYFAETTQTHISVREKYSVGCNYPQNTDRESCGQEFQNFLDRESTKRGFNIENDAITEEEFFATSRQRRQTGDSVCSGAELQVPSLPPSPQSLQPHPSDSDYNPHRKLTTVSSLSAPEVNKGYNTSTQDLTAKNFLSSSLSRFDNVRKRQIMRMRKRSNWFLSPNTSTSLETGSFGSREASVGKCSMATSSDILMSDITASDGGMSETVASDNDVSFGEQCCGGNLRMPVHVHHDQLDRLSPCAATEAHTNHQHVHTRDTMVPAHHSTPCKAREIPSSSAAIPHQQESGSCPSPQVSDSDVRYFMVETHYGPTDNGHS